MATAVTWRFASNNGTTLAANDLVYFIFSILLGFSVCIRIGNGKSVLVSMKMKM